MWLFASVLLAASGFSLGSPDIHAGQPIPAAFTCTGGNRSPALIWSEVPPGTRSFALVVSDPDAPGGTFFHWAVFDIPAAARGWPPPGSPVAAGAKEGINDFGRAGYDGPCPPPGPAHRYRFRIYALDRERLELPAGARARDVDEAARARALDEAELTATFGRSAGGR